MSFCFLLFKIQNKKKTVDTVINTVIIGQLSILYQSSFYVVCDSRSYLLCYTWRMIKWKKKANAHTTRKYHNRTIIVDIGFVLLWLNAGERGITEPIYSNVAIKRWKQSRWTQKNVYTTVVCTDNVLMSWLWCIPMAIHQPFWP